MTHQMLIRPEARAWAQDAMRRAGQKIQRLEDRRKRKFLLVHLDGVPRALIDKALSEGRMPFLKSLIDSGAYNLDGAFWGSPASTPCFQAGVLYGIRHPNLPAYNWFERDLGREVRMNAPKDAVAIEARLRAMRPTSLLAGGGSSYLTLFQADARNLMCMTALADIKQAARNMKGNLRGISAPRRRSPIRYLRDLLRDAWHSGLDVFRWARKVNDWRHEKQYFMNRFFMMNLAWQLSHTQALMDMMRGVPSIYLVFGNFDEVAHRRGPMSEQATAQLFQVDAALEELYTLGKTLDEPYDLFFVTDHGHVDSVPFEKRNQLRLKSFLIDGPPMNLSADIERALLDGRLIQPAELKPKEEPVVIEAGNFSHVYLTRDRKPLEAMELLQRFPDVIARAASSKDIGIVALRRGDSAVAIVKGKVYTADEMESAPLSSEFNKRAVADLVRELPHMQTAGDLVLYGEAVQQGGTVGFAWEFGSHGGLTKIETNSVVCWPSDVPIDLSALSHSTQLHEKLSEYYRN